MEEQMTEKSDGDWKPVDGYLALTLMKLSEELVELEHTIKDMRFAICHNEPAYTGDAKASARRLMESLRAVDYCFEDEREKRKAKAGTITLVPS